MASFHSYVGLPGGNELYNGDLTIEDGDFLVLAPNVPTILGKKYQINEQSCSLTDTCRD